MKIYQEWEEFEEYGVTKLSLSAIAICHYYFFFFFFFLLDDDGWAAIAVGIL